MPRDFAGRGTAIAWSAARRARRARSRCAPESEPRMRSPRLRRRSAKESRNRTSTAGVRAPAATSTRDREPRTGSAGRRTARGRYRSATHGLARIEISRARKSFTQARAAPAGTSPRRPPSWSRAPEYFRYSTISFRVTRCADARLQNALSDMRGWIQLCGRLPYVGVLSRLLAVRGSRVHAAPKVIAVNVDGIIHPVTVGDYRPRDRSSRERKRRRGSDSSQHARRTARLQPRDHLEDRRFARAGDRLCHAQRRARGLRGIFPARSRRRCGHGARHQYRRVVARAGGPSRWTR